MQTSRIPGNHSSRAGWLCVLVAAILVSSACSRSPQAQKAASLKSAESYAKAGKYAEALVEYRNAVQADPRDGEVRLKLADAFAKTGDSSSAVSEYIRAADLLPSRVDVQLKAGGLLLLAGSFDDARVRAQKALALDPRNVDAQLLLANSLAGLKDFNAAISELEQAIRLAPERGASFATLGAIELRRGQTDAAERAYKKATELDNASAPAHLALANFYWSQRRLAQAEVEMQKALDLEPENILAHRAIASYLLGQKRPAEAEKHLLKVLELTHSTDAALMLADFYAANRNNSAARKVLQPLASSPQSAGRVAPRLAALDYAAGDRKTAYARVNEALTFDRSNLEALLGKSNMLLADGKPEEALVAAQSSVQAHPESAEAFFTLGRVEMARKQIGPATEAMTEALRLNPRATGAQIALAQLHLAAGRSADSIVFAEGALKNDPANAEARLLLARSLIARGELERAEEELRRLSADLPDSAAVHAQKGILLGRKKSYNEARAEFAEALRLQPDSVEAVGGLAALELQAGRPEVARAMVRERASGDANTALMMVAARTCLATGDLAGGEEMLRRVLKKDPAYLPAYSALGQLYVKQRRLDAALDEFDGLARRDQRSVPAATLAGMILQAQGKTGEARERFERALAIDPSAPVAANNLAWIHATSGGDLNLALQLANTAHERLPDAPEVNDTLGFIFYKKNLMPMALRALKFAVDKDPAEPAYRYHLALVLAKTGDTAGARQQLTQALRLKGDFEGSAEARAFLKTLESR